MISQRVEVIAVRSLTESDLGLFAAHRAAARSKQRAININATVAKVLLCDEALGAGGGYFDCECTIGDTLVSAERWFGKIHKNWRLGGKKIDGNAFAQLDSKDFVLIRSVIGNDGTSPLILKFIAKKLDRVVHAGIAAIVERDLKDSMAVYRTGDAGFDALAAYCGGTPISPPALTQTNQPQRNRKSTPVSDKSLPRMPHDELSITGLPKSRTIKQKLRTPHILEKMLQVSGDLSAPAQLRFMETVRELAEQLRHILVETNGIVTVPRNHPSLWSRVKNQHIGFVDGGLANLSMLGSAPIAARVGGYIVVPGRRDSTRESFRVLKHLIDELYASSESGVYDDSFPDVSALRDAARISIEAAGAVQMLAELPQLKWVMLHGALVNPVSRYTDVMRDGRVRHRFPDFSSVALRTLLPSSESERNGRNRNFISVHLRQLELMQQSRAIVCGVIEREATTASVCKALLAGLDDDAIAPLLPVAPAEWKRWFRSAVDPADDDDFEGQRITDSLLFRCVLEPGEALRPVIVDRNELRRAPQAWHDVIAQYPRPAVSYLQQTEWGAPIRVELFEKDLPQFAPTIELIYHCALLLPNYAFPVGLDIVDKFARIPDWMSRPVNTRTAVLALKRALDSGDSKLFDSIRFILCGSTREWLFRPGLDR
jgi:hypothetical protein